MHTCQRCSADCDCESPGIACLHLCLQFADGEWPEFVSAERRAAIQSFWERYMKPALDEQERRFARVIYAEALALLDEHDK